MTFRVLVLLALAFFAVDGDGIGRLVNSLACIWMLLTLYVQAFNTERQARKERWWCMKDKNKI